MILLLVTPYVILTVCCWMTLDIMFGLWVYGLLLQFSIIYAFLLPGLGFGGKQLLFWNLLLNLCNIPLVNLIRVFTPNLSAIPASELPWRFMRTRT